jgi:hypothetical protein
LAVQGAVDGEQVATDEAQVPFVGSQMPEQHCAPYVQVPPKARHETFASPPPEEPSPPEDPTVPSPDTEPSPPLPPEELPLDPSASVPPELEPLVDASFPAPEPPPLPLPLEACSALASPDTGELSLVPHPATARANTHIATPRKCLFMSPQFVRVISRDRNSETATDEEATNMLVRMGEIKRQR